MDSLDYDDFFTLGLGATQQGKFQRAIVLFEKSLSLNEVSTDALLRLAACYSQIGMYRQAKIHTAKALSRDSARTNTLFMLGLANFVFNDFTGAKTAWRKIGETNSCHPLYCFMIGLKEWASTGRSKECIDWLNRGIAENTEIPEMNVFIEQIIETIKKMDSGISSDLSGARHSLY